MMSHSKIVNEYLQLLSQKHPGLTIMDLIRYSIQFKFPTGSFSYFDISDRDLATSLKLYYEKASK